MANRYPRLQAGITIDTKDKKPEPPQRPPPMNRPGGQKGENMPPPGRRGPPPGRYPLGSREDAMRRVRRQRPDGDGPASPPRREGPGSGRRRRNSESSLAELTEDEKKAREARRERRRREGRDRPPKSHRDMDLIDKLDATGIYGTGRKRLPPPNGPNLKCPVVCVNVVASLPPLWSIRRCHCVSQQSRQQSRAYGCFRQGLGEHVNRRLWPAPISR